VVTPLALANEPRSASTYLVLVKQIDVSDYELDAPIFENAKEGLYPLNLYPGVVTLSPIARNVFFMINVNVLKALDPREIIKMLSL